MEDEAERWLATLRRRGHRLTAQRQAILTHVAGARGHISAEAVHRAVAAVDPGVNRSTVYRTLDLLERHGFLVHHHDATGINYHHVDEYAHIHLSCLSCGHVRAIDDLTVGDDLARLLEERYGFRPNLTHSTLFGVCRRCAEGGCTPDVPHRHGVTAGGEAPR